MHIIGITERYLKILLNCLNKKFISFITQQYTWVGKMRKYIVLKAENNIKKGRISVQRRSYDTKYVLQIKYHMGEDGVEKLDVRVDEECVNKEGLESVIKELRQSVRHKDWLIHDLIRDIYEIANKLYTWGSNDILEFKAFAGFWERGVHKAILKVY